MMESGVGFKNLFEGLPIGVAIATREGVAVDVNPALVAMLGYDSKEEALRMPVSDHYLNPADRKRLLLAGEKGVVKDFEVQLKRKDGTPIWVAMDFAGQTTDSGLPLLLTTFRDITEMKRAKEALEQERNRTRKYLDTAGVMFLVLDAKGEIVLLNQKGSEILGCDREEVIGKDWFQRFVPSDMRSEVSAVFADLMTGKIAAAEYHENPVVTTSGEERLLAWHNTILKDGEGNIIGTLSSGEDITDRRRAEAQILAEKEFTDTALDAQLDTFFLFEPASGKALRWNRSFRDISGYADEEIARMPAPASYYSPEDLELATGFIEKVLVEGTGTIELELMCKDGRRVPTEYQVSVIKDARGEPEHIIAIGRDITERRQVDDELRRSEERFRLLFDLAPDAYYLTNLEGTLLDGNEAAEAIVGYKREELIGKSFLELGLLSAAQLPKATKLLALNALGKATGPDEFTLNRTSGEQASVEIRTRPIVLEGEKVVLGVARDISDRQQAQRKLAESEERYRALFDHADDAILLMRNDQIIDCNAKTLEMFGRSMEQIIGRTPADFSPDMQPDGLKSSEKALDKLAAALRGTSQLFEWEHHRPDGTPFHVEVNLAPIKLKGEDHNFAVVRDITERKRAEENYRQVVENAGEGIFVAQDDRLKFANPKVFEYLERSPEEIGSTPFLEFVHPEDRARMEDRYVRRLAGETLSGVTSYRILTPDGGTIWVEANTVPITWEGRPATLNFVDDITDRKKAEDALRALATTMSAHIGLGLLGEICRHLTSTLDLDCAFIGELTGEDERIRVIAGVGNGEPMGPFEFELAGTPCQNVVGQELCSYVSGVQELFPTDPLLVEMDIESYVGAPLFGDRGHPLGILALMDSKPLSNVEVVESLLSIFVGRVSAEIQRLRSMEELQKKEAQQSLVLDSLPMAFYIARPFGDYGGTWVSDQIGRITGFSAEEFLEDTGLWAARLHPEDREKTFQAFEGVTETDSVTVEYRWQHADGHYLWFLDQGVLVRDGEGAPKEIIGTWLDMSDRKWAEQELQEKEAQLQQSQRLEAVGRLAGGIAHDFNNMLGVIVGYGDLALHKLDQADPLRKNIEQIRVAADKAARLTQQLLIFSRKQTAQPKALDLNELVKGTVKMLHRLIGEDISLRTELANELGTIKADPGHIDQVIVNLAVNARDAMPQGGELVVGTKKVEIGEGHTSVHGDIVPGSYVVLTVSDTGHGMNEDVVSRIFEPFFTTKEKGKGTGLGLATVYGIVQQSGGFMQVQSEPQKGTSFQVYLPRVEESVGDEEVKDWSDAAGGAGENVLLVEDDEAFREMVVEMLMDLGYSVIEAGSPGEAILHCEQHQGPIDIMLTDVVMPQMSGRQLAERVAPLHPEMRIVYMSGYTDDAIGQHGVLDPEWLFIEKPFTADALGLKLHEALGTA